MLFTAFVVQSFAALPTSGPACDEALKKLSDELVSWGEKPMDGIGPLEWFPYDGIYGSPGHEFGSNRDYPESLKEIFRKTKSSGRPFAINRFLSQRKSKGKTTNVLDLMGSGFFI